MIAVLFFSTTNTPTETCAQYKDRSKFMDDLKLEKTMAINCLSSKIYATIYQIGKKHRLVEDDILELHSDCIMIFIRKIRTGQYEYQGNEPSTYVIEIAKRKVFHYSRKSNQHQTEDIELYSESVDVLEDGFLDQIEILESLIKELSDNCSKLIRLKYLEEMKDKEIISSNLTQYTTVDALKNHRSQCFKKLMSLAKQSNFYKYD